MVDILFPKGWPRQNPLRCKHCLDTIERDVQRALDFAEFERMEEDAHKIVAVWGGLIRRNRLFETRKWQDFVIANKHRFAD